MFAQKVTVGSSIFDIVEQHRLKNIASVFTSVLSGQTIKYDRSYVSRAGKTFWITFSFSPVKKGNEISGVCITADDITEKKIAEQQKEFDRNNLNALINNTHDLIWSVDSDFKLITFNKACEVFVLNLTGTTITAGTDLFGIGFSEDVKQRYREYYNRAMQGEAFTTYNHNTYPVDYWAETSFYPIYEGKKAVGTACYLRDITERKKAEEYVRISNERFELVTNATSDIIWDWNLETGDLWWNKNYYSHFGYDTNKTPPDISSRYDPIHPDDRQWVLAGVSAAFENKQDFWKEEYRFLKADGSIAFVLDCAYIVYTPEKKPTRMVGAMLDITARKNAETLIQKSFEEKEMLANRMAVILNTLPANIALLNEKGDIIEVNEAWRRFAKENGYEHEGYGMGQNYLAISGEATGSSEKDGRLLADGLKSIIEHETKNFIFEYPCHSPGIKRWFRMIATRLEDKAYSGAVVMHIDISALRKLEEERLKSKMTEQKKITRAMLLAQEKERSQLGQELHDNISQLLAAIRMKLSLHLSKNKTKPAVLVDCINNLEEAVTETRNLSHRMLMPRFKDSSFQDALKELAKNYSFHGRNVMVNATNFAEKEILPIVLETFYRITQEQLHNIDKHAKATQVLITLKSSHLFNTMIIQDDGIGFDAKKKRAGIGLTNIMNRAESFNGHVKIISEPGKGCLLQIDIPIAEK